MWIGLKGIRIYPALAATAIEIGLFTVIFNDLWEIIFDNELVAPVGGLIWAVTLTTRQAHVDQTEQSSISC